MVRALQRFPQPHSGKPPHKLLSGNLRPQAAFHGLLGVLRARVRPAGLAPPARRPQLPQPNSARFWGSNHATHAHNSLPVTCADVFPISWHIFVREGQKTVSPTRPPHPHAPTSCGARMHPERELCAMSSVIRCEKCSPGAGLHGTPPLLPPAACMMWCFVREMGEKLGRRLLSGWVNMSQDQLGETNFQRSCHKREKACS